MNFQDWKSEVDRYAALHFFGLITDDFPDYLWHDQYASGVSPFEAFNEWVEEVV